MKHELNGVTVTITPSDFGGMGLTLNPFDWFSGDTGSFTRAQNISAGQSWLTTIYNELKPNVSYAVFIDSLKLDSYSEQIPDEDYQDFLDTIGFAVNTSKAIADKVKASLLKSFSANKNMLPTRKSIVSAFLNPDVVKWTYWDAIKVTASDAYKASSSVAKGVADTVGTAGNIVAFILKYRWYILAAGGAGVGYFLWLNRGEVGARIKEAGFKQLGLGAK